jgi:hypothetical protein
MNTLEKSMPSSMPIPGIPPTAPKSSSTTVGFPSCSSSSAHLLKSVLMKGVLSFSFVSRGQYSDCDSFFRRTATRARDVRRLLDFWMTVRMRLNGQTRKRDLGIDFCEQVEIKRVLDLFSTMDWDKERAKRVRGIRLPGSCLKG